MSFGSLSAEVTETQLRRACADLDRRLREGEECRAEDYFEANPALAEHAEHGLELVYTEFVTREDLCRQPKVDEFTARFPQWRDRLVRLLHVHEALIEGADDHGDRAANFAVDTEVGTRAGAEAETWPPLRSHAIRSEHKPRVGPYELLEEVGRGGMGVVYKARQLGLDRLVALKMILSPHAGNRDRARFRSEAEAAARLKHPHIVQIYDVGEQDGCPYFAMEFVAGTSLDRELAETRLPGPDAARMIETMAQAMHYAHSRGVVHRDLKPANILLEPVNCAESQEQNSALSLDSSRPAFSPKISDFGLAKQLSEPDRSSHDALTRTGAVVGTPSYMSPEQADGTGVIGPAADVYALGAILYEMLTGVPPFQGATAFDILEQVRSHDPIAPRRLHANLPLELETICLKCLEKQPDKRYRTAGLLAEDLRRFLAGEPIAARPVRTWERIGKWARRRPAVATLIASIAALTVLGLSVVTWAWLHAEASRVVAENSRIAAVAAFGNAELARAAEQAERERVEKLLYDHNIALAHHEYLSNNPIRAVQLLDRCRPDLRNWEWLYLNRICHSEELVLTGHKLTLQSLVYSPDGKRIAASSGRSNRPDPGEIRVWDAVTGRELFNFPAQRGPISNLAFSSDSRWLASANITTGVRVWDMDDGSEQPRIELIGVVNVAFSPDGKAVAAGCSDGRVILYDSASHEPIRELHGHEKAVFSVAFNRDGTRLASGSGDGTARIWRISDGQEQLVFRDLHDVRTVTFSPDGSQLLAATFLGTVKIWDSETGAVIATYPIRTADAHIVLSPDGQSFAIGTLERGTQIWRTNSGTLARTIPQNSVRVCFSPDGTRVAAAGIDRVVRVWNLTAEPNPREFPVTSGARIGGMDHSPNGKYLALVTKRNNANPGSGANDKTLRIWDVNRRRVARICRGHTDWLTSVAFSPDGRRVATGSLDKTVCIWGAGSGQLQQTLEGHAAAVTSVAFSDDGQRIASATSDGSLRFFDANTAAQIQLWQGHDANVNSIAFAPRGQCFVSGGDDNTIRVWNSVTGDAIATLACKSAVNRLAFSRDGTLLASACADGLIEIWTVASIVEPGSQVEARHVLHGHTDAVTGLGFSSDSKRLASTGMDRTVTIWDVTAGDEVITFRSRSGDNPLVQFNPAGRYLVATVGQAITVWDCQRDQPDPE